MSTKRTTKKNNPSNEVSKVDLIALILIILIVLLFEIVGDYFERHAEEHRKESWERFERRNAEIMNSVDWSKAYK